MIIRCQICGKIPKRKYPMLRKVQVGNAILKICRKCKEREKRKMNFYHSLGFKNKKLQEVIEVRLNEKKKK